MAWILVLYWSLHGEIVLNHEVFADKAACEARVEAMRKVFEFLHHDDWAAACQVEKKA